MKQDGQLSGALSSSLGDRLTKKSSARGIDVQGETIVCVCGF